MTKRRARYLREYPQRIAHKRLKRNKSKKIHMNVRQVQNQMFKKALADYIKTKPAV